MRSLPFNRAARPDQYGLRRLVAHLAVYYRGFFGEDGRLNIFGELGIAAGVVALWALTFPLVTTLPMMPKAIDGLWWKRSQRMGYVALVFLVVHWVVFGVSGDG